MRQEELAVHLHHLEDAKCVAETLGQGDASVTPSKTGWTSPSSHRHASLRRSSAPFTPVSPRTTSALSA
jgi:hypothetical protein